MGGNLTEPLVGKLLSNYEGLYSESLSFCINMMFLSGLFTETAAPFYGEIVVSVNSKFLGEKTFLFTLEARGTLGGGGN